MVLAFGCASCNHEDDMPDKDAVVSLGVNVSLEEMYSGRSIVKGEYLASGDRIGISVVADESGGNYDGLTSGYINVAYRATGNGASQVWNPADASKQIMLSGTEGRAIAYYPYTADITDYTAIPVDIADQHDWMYSGEVGPLHNLAPDAGFVMRHALTAVNVNVMRDESYTGAGLVSTLTVESEGLATTGTFSAVDGVFSTVDGVNTSVSVMAAPFTLDGTNLTSKENLYMFVPASDETKDFTVTATVDGNPYKVTVSMSEAFAAGKIYQINIKATNTGMIIDSVVVLGDWVDEDLSEGNLKPNKNNS